MIRSSDYYATKVPEVTLTFWIIKIAATTLGETGGDSVTMTLNWGYLTGTAIFLSLLVVLVGMQIAAKKFHPFLYWATIVASTTAGTTMADFADRSLGIGYTGGSSLLFALPPSDARPVVLVARLHIGGNRQHTQGGSVLLDGDHLFTNAGNCSRRLDGRHDGSWLRRGALVFAAGLAVLAAAYYWTSVSRVLLFWAAFILTRPLGATVGDFLDKPVNDGGLALSRPIASAVIAAFILGCLVFAAAARRQTSGTILSILKSRADRSRRPLIGGATREPISA